MSSFKSNSNSNSYDLALIDIRMPELNGFELCNKIRKLDSKVKLCLMSAFYMNSAELREHYPLLDIECFIPKPIHINELVNRLETELLR